MTRQTRRVELFVRSLSPETGRGPADDHIERLRRFADAGAFDLTVTVWGREVPLSTTAASTGAAQSILDRVARFREWADARDVCVDTFFETRHVDAEITGESHTVLVLPVCCLAVYEDEQLVSVAPYTTGSAVHAVADAVDALDPAREGPDRPGDTPTDRRVSTIVEY